MKIEVAAPIEAVAAITNVFEKCTVSPIFDSKNSLVELVTKEQGMIDKCIDHLRRAQLSIVRLDPHRPSLEQVFLSAVDDPHAVS